MLCSPVSLSAAELSPGRYGNLHLLPRSLPVYKLWHFYFSSFPPSPLLSVSLSSTPSPFTSRLAGGEEEACQQSTLNSADIHWTQLCLGAHLPQSSAALVKPISRLFACWLSLMALRDLFLIKRKTHLMAFSTASCMLCWISHSSFTENGSVLL